MHRVRKTEQAGFTLQEILIAMAILGIIAIVAIPNFNAYMKVTRGRTVVNEMVGALNLARQQAVTSRDAHAFLANSTTETWQLWNLATPEMLRQGEMPPGVTIETPAIFQFDSRGQCVNPTTYVGTTPQTQYIRIEAVIQPSRTDRYTFTVSSVGRITTTHDVVVP